MIKRSQVNSSKVGVNNQFIHAEARDGSHIRFEARDTVVARHICIPSG
jgi:hypothetical protein